jgi:uncharacterized protein (DUF2267 family)
MTTLGFYRRVIDETGQTDRETVKRGTAAVLQALRDRLIFTEAHQAAAQFPRSLKEVWIAGDRPDRKPVKMHRRAFYERVQREAGLQTVREARFFTIAVFAALKEQLSGGEADDVLAQLPRDLKDVWEDA